MIEDPLVPALQNPELAPEVKAAMESRAMVYIEELRAIVRRAVDEED